MSKQKLTKWFPAYVMPARIGVYEVRPDDIPHYVGPWYSLWNGWRWLGTCAAIERAESFGKEHGPTDLAPLSWRGLASQPKDSAPRG